MPQRDLPRASEDVLAITPSDMPAVIRDLVQARRLSPLMARIHAELRSDDPALRRRSGQALRHMGFPD